MIAMVRTTRSMLNKSGESRHPCLVPHPGGNALRFSPWSMMFAMVLSYITFIMLSYVPSMPTFRVLLS